jgi:acetyl-CoA synthetase
LCNTKYVFDYQDGDIYWCSADVGWVTGHSYIVYGPLVNGATTLMFEGVPTYPDASRFWQVIDKHQVNTFYTAPTAIRALMGAGDRFVEKTNRSSLRVLGTVGEPINPEAWEWYYHKIGNGKCPIVDTWWQTETGGHMITPLPYATALKPGSASKPFFGIEPQVVNEKGEVLDPLVFCTTITVSTQSQAATAISTLALRGVALPPRIPLSAVITILHSESKILSLSASGENPPNTTL